jgi:hypothetical protein
VALVGKGVAAVALSTVATVGIGVGTAQALPRDQIRVPGDRRPVLGGLQRRQGHRLQLQYRDASGDYYRDYCDRYGNYRGTF